jgi:hypothetical protein
MSDYRIEYLSDGDHPEQRLSLAVPDITTALVVAEINRPDGEVELWQGDRQLARLQRAADSASWTVS